MFRIGFGYDAHRLVEGRALILGGIDIPHEKGLLGHSDADVTVHAIMDAVLGALGLGDIGQHFPDTDPAYKNADSMGLLDAVMEKAKHHGFKINNLDATIVAQEPKLSPYLSEMKQKISKAMNALPEQINIKATTTEGMGFCGTREGIAAYAVVSLVAV